jgi:outer membrane protein, heavy metal efflux system
MDKLILFIALLFSFIAPVQAAESLSLEALLLRAREHNPEILEARQAWKVKQAEIRPAGTWDNPTLSYFDERQPSGMDNVGPEQMYKYRIEQSIPFPGKLTNASRMKRHEALIARANYQAVTLEVFKNTRMRYYQLYLTDQQFVLAGESVEILSNALRGAQSRLASSQSSALDVFMVQTELEKARNNQFQLQQQRLQIQYELNALLNQELETPLGSAKALEITDLPISLKDLQALAQRSDPMYLSSMHELNHARATRLHHRLAFAPDFGVMYEKQTAPAGPDGRMFGVSASIPLWFHRPWKELQGAQEHVDEAEAKARAMQNRVAKEVAVEYVEVNTRAATVRRYQSGILPSVKSALKIAQQRYASGQDDFMRLLEAYRGWIGSNTEYQEALYGYGEHWSMLEQWVGVDLSLARPMRDQMQWMPEGNHE